LNVSSAAPARGSHRRQPVRAARWRPALAVLWTGIASSRGSTMALPDVPPFTKLLGVNVLHRSPERTEAELPRTRGPVQPSRRAAWRSGHGTGRHPRRIDRQRQPDS